MLYISNAYIFDHYTSIKLWKKIKRTYIRLTPKEYVCLLSFKFCFKLLFKHKNCGISKYWKKSWNYINIILTELQVKNTTRHMYPSKIFN